MSDDTNAGPSAKDTTPATTAGEDETRGAPLDAPAGDNTGFADFGGTTFNVAIPENWRTMHWKQRVGLARQLSGKDPSSTSDADETIARAADERGALSTIAARAKAEAIENGEDDGLIEMSKDGETLRVHPATVNAHRKAGWK